MRNIYNSSPNHCPRNHSHCHVEKASSEAGKKQSQSPKALGALPFLWGELKKSPYTKASRIRQRQFIAQMRTGLFFNIIRK